jgi:hypothetical protein
MRAGLAAGSGGIDLFSKKALGCGLIERGWSGR